MDKAHRAALAAAKKLDRALVDARVAYSEANRSLSVAGMRLAGEAIVNITNALDALREIPTCP